MAKKLRDYLMKEGVIGKKFVDSVYNRSQEIIYEIIGIEPLGIGLRPSVLLYGTIVGSDEIYIKNLALCLEHEEYSESIHAQTLPKCTSPVNSYGPPARPFARITSVTGGMKRL